MKEKDVLNTYSELNFRFSKALKEEYNFKYQKTVGQTKDFSQPVSVYYNEGSVIITTFVNLYVTEHEFGNHLGTSFSDNELPNLLKKYKLTLLDGELFQKYYPVERELFKFKVEEFEDFVKLDKMLEKKQNEIDNFIEDVNKFQEELKKNFEDWLNFGKKYAYYNPYSWR